MDHGAKGSGAFSSSCRKLGSLYCSKCTRTPWGCAMFGFNALLQDAGVDPADVKLARHQDTRRPGRATPYQLWLAGDGRLQLYQRIQRRPVFKDARVLASFVATPLDETVFVGLYDIRGVGTAPAKLIDPVSGIDVAGFHLYDLRPSKRLAEYRGRLIVDWGPGYRSWVQLAGKKDKAIIEIRRTFVDPPFPGFLDFRSTISGLAAVPAAWRTVLSSVGGVCILIHPETGKQYVGSAQSSGGFWARWEAYVASGHGGNRKMQDVPKADYQVAVLEVASSSTSKTRPDLWSRERLLMVSRLRLSMASGGCAGPEGRYKFSGRSPVRFAISASMTGPISSLSWKAKRYCGQPSRRNVR
jgi:hypothetical protein